MKDLIKPKNNNYVSSSTNNYNPIISSDSVLLQNKSLESIKEKSLLIEKYLSEFETEEQKKAARDNIGVYSTEQINEELDKFPDTVMSGLLDSTSSPDSVKINYGVSKRSTNQIYTESKEIPSATQDNAGVMSAQDKTNLDVTIPNKIIEESNRAQQKEQELDKKINTTKADIIGSATDNNNTLGKLESSLNTHISNQQNPHHVTKEQVGLGNITNDAQVKRTEMGVALGVATLDESGLVPSNQLPSYVDDIVDCYATYTKNDDGTVSDITLYSDAEHQNIMVGESGKIYVDITGTSSTYQFRWTGTRFSVVGAPTVIGEITGTAFDGARGKILEDTVNTHITDTSNPHKVTAKQAGAIPTGGLKTINGNTLEGEGDIVISSEDEGSLVLDLTEIPNAFVTTASTTISDELYSKIQEAYNNGVRLCLVNNYSKAPVKIPLDISFLEGSYILNIEDTTFVGGHYAKGTSLILVQNASQVAIIANIYLFPTSLDGSDNVITLVSDETVLLSRMKGYSKQSSYSTITEQDTIGAAIGKLEAKEGTVDITEIFNRIRSNEEGGTISQEDYNTLSELAKNNTRVVVNTSESASVTEIVFFSKVENNIVLQCIIYAYGLYPSDIKLLNISPSLTIQNESVSFIDSLTLKGYIKAPEYTSIEEGDNVRKAIGKLEAGLTTISLGGKIDPNSDGTGEMFNDYKSNVASGSYSHSEGLSNTVSGKSAHAEGSYNTASGTASHAEGSFTNSTAPYSHSQNYMTVADNYCQTSIGILNESDSNPSSRYDFEKPAFVIGNGLESIPSQSNAFKVLFNGKTFADGEYSSTGADYAEMFEWEDGNPNNEDRVGRFVTLSKKKIIFANETSNYILGIVSGAPTIIGDNPMRWHNKYENDEWGRPIYEDIEVEYTEPEVQSDGTVKQVKKTRTDHVRKLNPLYNPKETYIPRTQRKEWDFIGMIGKLLVKQDGTLVEGEFCKPSVDGIATKSDNGYYVMQVINNNQALILFK